MENERKANNGKNIGAIVLLVTIFAVLIAGAVARLVTSKKDVTVSSGVSDREYFMRATVVRFTVDVSENEGTNVPWNVSETFSMLDTPDDWFKDGQFYYYNGTVSEAERDSVKLILSDVSDVKIAYEYIEAGMATETQTTAEAVWNVDIPYA